MGILDGDGGLNVYLGGIVDPDSIRALQQQNAWNNLITTMGAIGAASGPSPRPVPLGSVFGQGALAGQEAQRQNLRDTLSGLYTGQAIKGAGINNAINMLNLRGWQGILGGGGNPGTGVAPGGLLNPGGTGGGLLGTVSPDAAAAASAKGPAATALNAPPGVSVKAPGSPGVTFESPGTPEGQPSVTLGADDVRAARSPMDAAATAAKIDQATSGSSSPPAQPGGSSQPTPVLDPATLIARARQYMTFPAGLATANQLLGMAQKMMPEGTVLMSDGSVALPRGADQAMMTRALAEKGFTRGADGYFHPDPGYVAGQAQITSAQEWAKVAPQLYEKGHEPFDLSRPGASRYAVGPDGRVRLVAQNPMMVESVDSGGTPFRSFVNPPVTGAGGSLLNPAPQSAPTGGLLNPQSSAPGTGILSGVAPAPGVNTMFPGWYLRRGAVAPQPTAQTAPAPTSNPPPSTPAPTASGTPGVTTDAQGRPVIQTGLSPLAQSSAHARGTQLEEYGTQLQKDATNAVNGQFLIDQMRRESGNGAGWEPGRYADWIGGFRSMLQGALGDKYSSEDLKNSLGNFQSFQKNSMQLVTQATRAVSPRAAVQEMQMIREALPGSHLSSTGLRYIFDQLSANNDFMLAKNQAADAWRGSHNGTLAGFESAWNQSVSPFAFLAHRMSNDDFAAMSANLQKTPEGRALLGRIQGEVGTAAQLGFFQ